MGRRRTRNGEESRGLTSSKGRGCDSSPPSREEMAVVPAPARAARALAATAAALVLLWCVHFRGGLALTSPTNKGLIFNVHPVLMLIGFIILGSEAIMSYKTLPWSHDTNKMVHFLLHAAALFLGSFGVYAAFKFHNESGIDNLYSLHSWVGLVTICLYGVQWVSGFVTFFFPGASPTLRCGMLPWHVRAGLVVYVLALLAAELGFLEKLTFLQAAGLSRYSSEALLVNFTAVIVILLGGSVVLFATAPVHNEHTLGYSAVHKR